MQTTRTRSVSVFSLLLLTAVCCHATTSYTVSEIGTFGGPGSCPTDINNLGQVVGYADTPQIWGGGFYNTHAFLWQNGVTADLGTFGASSGYAQAVNDSATVIATAAINASLVGSFLWDSGTSSPIQHLDAALDINSAGVIAGTNYADSTHSSAVVLHNGSLVDLGTLGGTSSTAYSINDSGWVVGMAYDSGQRQRAFVWDGTTMTDIGPGAAYAINSCGQVCGSSFIWQNGVRTDIPDFTAYAINDLGQMVGTFYDRVNHAYRASVWNNGALTSLASLLPAGSPYRFESSLEPKYGINNAGQIVAVGYILGQGHHALVLTPVPEPSSFTALAFGLPPLALPLLRRKRQSWRRS